MFKLKLSLLVFFLSKAIENEAHIDLMVLNLKCFAFNLLFPD